MITNIVKDPEWYDLLYEGVCADVPLYIELTKNYKEVVEYGAGTGRITIPLAMNGKTVYAVDNEEKMLKKLKDNLAKTYDSMIRDNVVVINHNMITYIPTKKVDCVIMPLTVFNYLIEDREQDECLKNLYDNVLMKNGKLVFELLTEKTFKELKEKNDGYRFIKHIKINDNTYYEYWRKTYLNGNIIIQNRLFKKFESGKIAGEKNFFWKNRLISREEIERLLIKNGFKIINIYGNCHNMEQYNNDSEDMFIEAEKA